MIGPELSQRSQELAAAREPFVTATVVRVQHPASVEPGSVALVLADGTIEGFIGGVCAEHSVRAYSLVALERDEPVFLKIEPDPEGDPADTEGTEVAGEEGVVTVRNPCLSGGTIEVLLEPAAPPPRIVVVGETPIAVAIARIAPELGLETVTSDGHDSEPAPGDLAVIVAAHGRDELHALRRGLESRLPYVGLVASVKRGAGVVEELRADGVEEALLERIDVPAGLPIGSRTAGEVAVSVLARLVAVRRQGPDAPAVAPPEPERAVGGEQQTAAAESSSLAVDPICGMTVAAVESTLSVERNGETVYFCSEGCKAKFEAQEEHASLAR